MGGDVLVVAGGIGLAPLRPAVLALLAERDALPHTSRCSTVRAARRTSSTRTSSSVARARGIDVQTIVDHGAADWPGRVGLVTR